MKELNVLVVVDMQEDFLYGSLANEKADEVVKSNVELIKEYAKKATAEKPLYIIATKDTHLEDYLDTLEGERLPVKHCILGTSGWEITAEVKNAINEALLNDNVDYSEATKTTFGSFGLLNILETLATKYDFEVLFTGVCTDICVVSNALMTRAKFPNNIIKVVRNATNGTTVEATEAAFQVMQSCQIDIV